MGNPTFCFKDYLREKIKENNKQQEEIVRLREENSCLRDELALTGTCGQLDFPAFASSSSGTSRQQQVTDSCERGSFLASFCSSLEVCAVVCPPSVEMVFRASAGAVRQVL